MVRRLRAHTTYANLMATLAVFIALGGTSYAAIVLPRNSVGSRQIKSGAVKRAELARGAVGTRALGRGAVGPSDLSASARLTLTGPQGPAGAPGAPAVTYRATVASTGALEAGNGVASGTDPSAPHTRFVEFAGPVSGCIPVATLRDDVSGGLRARVSDGNRVIVTRLDTTGSPAPIFAAFNLIVAC